MDPNRDFQQNSTPMEIQNAPDLLADINSIRNLDLVSNPSNNYNIQIYDQNTVLPTTPYQINQNTRSQQ